MKKRVIVKLIVKTAATIISYWSHLYKQVEVNTTQEQCDYAGLHDVVLMVPLDQDPFSTTFLRGTKQ